MSELSSHLKELVPEGSYKAVISAIEPFDAINGERRYRVYFNVDCEPQRILTKEYSLHELLALKDQLT